MTLTAMDLSDLAQKLDELKKRVENEHEPLQVGVEALSRNPSLT